MMMSSVNLPLEIWFTIVEYFPRFDQLCIAQVSLQLCAIVRRIIYHNIDLRSNDVGVEATLALLSRDHTVARNMRRLHICTDAKAPKGPAWFDPEALTGMADLHHLELTRMPFHTEDGQLKFNNTVSKFLSALRKLEYRWRRSGGNYARTFNSGTHLLMLQIGGLHEITWIDPGAYSIFFSHLNFAHKCYRNFRSPLIYPNPDLCVPRDLDPHPHPPAHPLPRNPQSPHGVVQHPFFPSLLAPPRWLFTDFLIAHPLIEDLHLHFSDDDPDGEVVYYQVSPTAIGPGTLPNLRHLTADAFNLGVFLCSEVLSLRTLESLHTGVAYFDEKEHGRAQFVEMFHMLEAKGGLPGLKVLELEFDGLNDRSGDARWIAGFGKLCPQVEWFWGDRDVAWTAVSHLIGV